MVIAVTVSVQHGIEPVFRKNEKAISAEVLAHLPYRRFKCFPFGSRSWDGSRMIPERGALLDEARFFGIASLQK